METHVRVLWRFKREFSNQWEIFMDINSQARYADIRVIPKERKITRNREIRGEKQFLLLTIVACVGFLTLLDSAVAVMKVISRVQPEVHTN